MKKATAVPIIMLSVLLLSSCTVSQPESKEKPKVEITSGAVNIDIIADDRFNSQSLIYIMDNTNADELPYVSLKSKIEIKFKGTIPDRFELNDQIFTSDGIQENSTSTPVDYKTVNGAFVLIISPGTFFSKKPAFYANRKTIRGIELTCSFGENSYTYAFMVRTDSSNSS